MELKVNNDTPTGELAIGRRGFLSWGVGAAAAGIGSVAVTGAAKSSWAGSSNVRHVRPPGSVPEREFLQRCIRCGECFKACPNNVLQPKSFQQGLDGLWTPLVNANWAGCESSCKEDRLMSGSYIELRAARERKAQRTRRPSSDTDYFIPDLPLPENEAEAEESPF